MMISALGVTLDALTTKTFIGDLGIEYEGNKFAKRVFNKWGFKVWLCLIEPPPVILLALVDSMLGVLFCGVTWGVARGLIAARNCQVITLYRIVGVENFKAEQDRNRKLLIGFSSTAKKLMGRMTNLACLVISVIALVSVLLIDSFFAILAAGLIAGMVCYLFAIVLKG
jgi:hypothetical protein